MSYETSYDTGLKPFNHDKTRGKWSSPMDFFYACIGHGFKVDAIFVLPHIIFLELGIYGLIPYILILATCVVPIVFMQSFLGQFSSTGFISVFRISPLFKGIGYVSLVLNFITLSYYSVFGAIPLFYIFHSLRPTLPWSCEGAKEWMTVIENNTSPCHNHTLEEYTEMQIPSLEFFKTHLGVFDFSYLSHSGMTFSWSLMFCTFLIWAMVGAILYASMDVMARFLRYSCLTVMGIICLCVIRFAFLPSAFAELTHFFLSTRVTYIDTWIVMPLLALSALGSGWGSVLTMASYNDFKTNIFKYSWILCFAQLGILMGLGLMSVFISSFLRKADLAYLYFSYIHTQWMDFLVTPTALTFLEIPHFWTLIFFGMMILGSLNLMTVQLFSVLTSLFDEYEKLRPMKREITLGAVGFLALSSIFFCSNHGLMIFETMSKFTIVTQMFLNMLLLLVVLWVYGRERFQRDVSFMTNRTYSTWMINIARFVAPLFLIISLLVGLLMSIGTHEPGSWGILIAIGVFSLLPWLLIPGYCIFKVMQTSGMLKMRLKRCVRPTDWYPVNPTDRQRYEEAFSNSEMTHTLTTDVE